MRFFLCVFFAGCLLPLPPLSAKAAKVGPVAITSPDGKIAVTFMLDKNGSPHYYVERGAEMIIFPSALGFTFRGMQAMTEKFAIDSSSVRQIDDAWKPVWGTASLVRNDFQELRICLTQQDNLHRRINVVFRAFNDGMAFRYEFPAQKGLDSMLIEDEITEFNLPVLNTQCWWINADYDTDENIYHAAPLAELKTANTPITARLNSGVHISIHEAALVNYASMTLVHGTKTNQFNLKCDLVPWPDGVKVRASAPMRTPWRTVQISPTAGGLAESHLIENLNSPCVLKDVSWIEPTKFLGIWWSLHLGTQKWDMSEGEARHGARTENVKKYIEYASEHHIGGVLVEGWNTGWENWGKPNAFDFDTPYPDFNMAEIAAYAKLKGIALIGHHETGGDIPNYEAQLEAAFSYYEANGIHAVKTGYAGEILPKGQHHYGQMMVQHYQRVVEVAARHHVTVDVHECIKPTGLCRTWPNLMSGEGARGQEWNAWSEGNPPSHTVTLPFTRFLAGPMDYTPGIFDLTFSKHAAERQELQDRIAKGYRVRTTLAHQLALYVVMFSPIQMAADLLENYEGNPAFAFIEKVPVTWDETRVPRAAIGEHATFLRRKGSAWYIGAITNEEARKWELPLDFLDPKKTYTAYIYADASDADFMFNPTEVVISQKIVTSKTILASPLARGGGVAVQIVENKAAN